MDELGKRSPPTFSSSAVEQQQNAPYQTAMAGRKRSPLQHTTAPEKEKLLIEEGFIDSILQAAPPPRWRSRRWHRRAPSTAAEHQRARPPEEEAKKKKS
jgi:hypothetical protein